MKAKRQYVVTLTSSWWGADDIRIWGPFDTKKAAAEKKSELLKTSLYFELRRNFGFRLFVLELHAPDVPIEELR